jgi:hypothetical protein
VKGFESAIHEKAIEGAWHCTAGYRDESSTKRLSSFNATTTVKSNKRVINQRNHQKYNVRKQTELDEAELLSHSVVAGHGHAHTDIAVT